MKLSQQTQIESQIGFLIGILIGAFSSWVLIMFFTPWEWYFKLGATIGEIGIIGSLSLALTQTIGQRRQYLDAKKAMESIEPTEERVNKYREEYDKAVDKITEEHNKRNPQAPWKDVQLEEKE